MLNIKHNLILQALCSVIFVSCWLITAPQCDLCTNKSLAVIGSLSNVKGSLSNVRFSI